MPNQNVVSIFSFGQTAGGLHAVFDILEVPLYYVTPQRWKKEVLGANTADKDDAINFCKQNCPNISLKATKRSKVDSDGIADAICIAVYGMKQEIIRSKHINTNNDKEESNGTTEG
jgi:Holliday junction resolvasome RuvABC endonuclease subunit